MTATMCDEVTERRAASSAIALQAARGEPDDDAHARSDATRTAAEEGGSWSPWDREIIPMSAHRTRLSARNVGARTRHALCSAAASDERDPRGRLGGRLSPLRG